MDYLPGIFLIVSALLVLRSRFAALIRARKAGDQSGDGLRSFIFSSLGSLGALLVGVSILLARLNHPWKSVVGILGSVLLLLALIRSIANAIVDYVRRRFPGRLRPFIFSLLGGLGALLVGASVRLARMPPPWKGRLGLLGLVLILLSVRGIANAVVDYRRMRSPPGRKDMGIGTLLGWMAGTTTGYFAGFLLTLVLYFVVSKWLGPLSSWSNLMKVVTWAAAGALVGLVGGLLQVRVLSPYLPESRWWIWATIAGFVVAYGLAEIIALGYNLESREGDARTQIELIIRVIAGGILGIFQGRVLQRWSLRAGWWPVLSALAAVAGYVAVELLLPRPSKPPISQFLAREVVSDIVESIVTGAGLLWLQKVKVSPSISLVLPSPISTNRPTQ
jgi:hypothetical protein